MVWTWFPSYEAYPEEYYILVTAVSSYSHLLGVCSIRVSVSSGKCCSVPVRGKFCQMAKSAPACREVGLNSDWFILCCVLPRWHSSVHVLHKAVGIHYTFIPRSLAQGWLSSHCLIGEWMALRMEFRWVLLGVLTHSALETSQANSQT